MRWGLSALSDNQTTPRWTWRAKFNWFPQPRGAEHCHNNAAVRNTVFFIGFNGSIWLAGGSNLKGLWHEKKISNYGLIQLCFCVLDGYYAALLMNELNSRNWKIQIYNNKKKEKKNIPISYWDGTLRLRKEMEQPGIIFPHCVYYDL